MKSSEKPSIIFALDHPRNQLPASASSRHLSRPAQAISLERHHDTFHPLKVILDTQALLDWQYFHDRSCARWRPPGTSWIWLATRPMRVELEHVLRRGFGAGWHDSGEHVLAFFDHHATLADPEAVSGELARVLRCTDPDDQKFIDLAIHAGADFLISRDHAVLKLRRRADRVLGLRIVSPASWHPPDPDGLP